MGSRGGIDLCILGQSFPHVLDSIILFSDKKTQSALRLTCQLLRLHLDTFRCRQLRGDVWYFTKFRSLVAVEVHDSCYPSALPQVALYHWRRPAIPLPGLRTAMSIHATNTPAVAMEAAYTMAGSGVVPHLDHSRGPAYYPLDKCPRAVLEFDMIGCCCNTAQPIDYRLRTREVTVDIAWRGDPVANSWLYEPSASDDDDYHYRRRAYYDTPLTDCNLLKQVLHVELETLRLVFPFSLLQVKAPALILPKLPEDFILPQSFRMTLEIHRVKEPSGAKLGEIRREFAEHFGVNETQVTIELQHLRLYNPSWWSSELSDGTEM